MEHCDRYEALLSQSLDGPLAVEDRQALDAHLDQCPQCRALAAQFDEIRAGFADFEEQEVPAHFAQGVMDKIRALEEPTKVIPLWRKPQVRALGSLAACAVLCAGLLRADLFPAKSGAPEANLESTAAPQDAEPRTKPTYTPEAENDFVFTAVGADSGSDSPESAAEDLPAPTAYADAPAEAPPQADEMPKAESSARQTPPPQATFSVGQTSTLPPDHQPLYQVVTDALGTAPGVLLVVEELPQDLTGTTCSTQEGYAILALDEIPEDAVYAQLMENALLCLDMGDGPIVLVVQP